MIISRVCSQFMVTNGLDEAAVREQATSLNFPTSVVEFFQGAIGIPYGGFPQPLQSQARALHVRTSRLRHVLSLATIS